MRSNNIILAIFVLSTVVSCGIYSFNGASIDYNQTRTLSIANFVNDSGGGPPNMGLTFSEGLKDYFQRRTKLELVASKGDMQFEGIIGNYLVRPQSVTSSGNSNVADGTGLMRLQISVNVVFTNTKKEEESFERQFSFFSDYDPSANSLNSIENDLVEEIFEQIYFDIFQASVAQW